MNIFLLDKDPKLAAQYHCDKHVVKMVLETAQLLCSIHEQGEAPYRRTHYNHPCAKWVRECENNYTWAVCFGLELCREYTHRYGKVHKSQAVIEWCRDNMIAMPCKHFSYPPQCMPDEYKADCTVDAYRAYYRLKAESIKPFKYTSRDEPEWLPKGETA